MSIACGTDIVEIKRIKETIEKFGEAFLNKVFTKEEINYCESKEKMKFQHYAARFAAKEAVFKAISNFVDNKFSIGWKNMEIINDKNGRPEIKLLNYKIEIIKNIDISLSHCKEYSVAMVVVEC